MKIKSYPMGEYQTNCYIVSYNNKDIIIDPGVGATKWVCSNVTNPIAILNTHGHFDHVWSNSEIKDILKVPIYCPKDDTFMLEGDTFGLGVPPSKADYKVNPDEVIDLEGVRIKFRHFPGHTPGCSVIEIKDVWFSGDFLFEGSIGRWDFPYSSGKDMLKSLQKVSKVTNDYTLYPGHGRTTKLQRELKNINYWISQVKMTIR